jgi:hypothetical protein
MDTELPQESLALRPTVVSTVLEDGAVLLDLDTKYFYSLNSSAWGIVQILENGASIESVLARCGAWGAGPSDRDAIVGVVAALIADGLLEEGPESDHPVELDGEWTTPTVERHQEPLQRLMTSAFDPTLPLAE